MSASSLMLRVLEPDTRAIHSLDDIAQHLGVSRRFLLLCCRYGIASAVAGPLHGGWYFDDQALSALRRAAALRALCGGSFAGARRILELEIEVERLRDELRFWRR